MSECQVSGSMVSEGATHHRSFSIRRAILVCYASGLFFATHNPLVHAESAEELNWLGWTVVGLGPLWSLTCGSTDPDKWFHSSRLSSPWFARILGRLFPSRTGNDLLPESRRWMTGGWLIVLGLLLAWGWLDEATQPFFGIDTSIGTIIWPTQWASCSLTTIATLLYLASQALASDTERSGTCGLNLWVCGRSMQSVL